MGEYENSWQDAYYDGEDLDAETSDGYHVVGLEELSDHDGIETPDDIDVAFADALLASQVTVQLQCGYCDTKHRFDWRNKPALDAREHAQDWFKYHNCSTQYIAEQRALVLDLTPFIGETTQTDQIAA